MKKYPFVLGNLLLSSTLAFVSVASVCFGLEGKGAKIDAMLHSAHEKGRFNGAVLVAEAGKIIYKNGFGMANREWNIPNTPDTRFRICSLTKPFTAMLAMQLVSEGKIQLDGKITDYLPDYRKDTGDKITIRHLLAHVSGLPNYTMIGDFMETRLRTPWKRDEFITKFCSGDLVTEPGKVYRYNNTGYYLLGAIIEEVTGKSYEENLTERILDPLGMKDSGYIRNEPILERRASGYIRKSGRLENDPIMDMSWAWSAGAIYSTVEDLYLWDRALYTDRLLPQKYRRIMMTPLLEENGCGWFVKKIAVGENGEKIPCVYHPGEMPGFRTLITRMIEDRHLVILLSNVSGGEQAKYNDLINEEIIRILYRDSPDSGKK